MGKYTKYDKQRNSRLIRVRIATWWKLKRLAQEKGLDMVELIDMAVDMLNGERRIKPEGLALAISSIGSAVASEVRGATIAVKSDNYVAIANRVGTAISITPKKVRKGE